VQQGSGQWWLSGPYGIADLDSMLSQNNWISSLRFGIRQGEKFRLGHDLSGSKINATVGASEKLNLMNLEEVVFTIRSMVRAREGCSGVKINESWRGIMPSFIKIAGLDSTCAYRQLLVAPMSRRVAVIRVHLSGEIKFNFYDELYDC